MKAAVPVRVWTEEVVLPTYEPAPPDKNPMFLEKRVYQGSSGKVYPLPFIDRIAEQPVERTWQAVWIENEFLRAMVLPEIGGRVHRLQDKTNGYDLIYHQRVIKPALVGLAGPWISGGIEFNWPQHHRPATFLPVDVEIEEAADGSKIIWCSDHDPLCRMKGMHGVCLRPGVACLELKVRVSNRTPLAQTFLWWANVATRVHEGYQSFFPPDVYYVADHARRSMSAYPLAQGHYYGVNYAERARRGVPPGEVPRQFVPPHCRKKRGLRPSEPGVPFYAPNDLSFYANIPVPTSYMGMGSAEDFFGGYDYKAQAGIVHVADHHIAPGKKQWTWGNHEFGYAWDRHLTDPDATGECAPYIELMAGVFTDNQPDFSFLHPGETRSWSQYWYPIQQIGPAQHAHREAAVSLRREGRGRGAKLSIGVAVTSAYPKARIRLTAKGRKLAAFTRDLSPSRPLVAQVPWPKNVAQTDLTLAVAECDGSELIRYRPKPQTHGEVPPPATEPPAPRDLASADELFITGLHLEQYRHATRCPTLYWREALRRDPFDARCNNAMGLWHLRRGEFQVAAAHFHKAIARLTRRNANPSDGEPFYHLGLCLRFLGREAEAYDAFSKATWNRAWTSAACLALAELDCSRQEWAKAQAHCEQAVDADSGNRRAMNLWALVVRRNGNALSAESMLRLHRAADPLDWWTRHLLGEELTCDLQTGLDLALDYARAGLFAEAIQLLETRAASRCNGRRAGRFAQPEGQQITARGCGLKPALPGDPRDLGAEPLLHYYLGWLHAKRGDHRAALAEFKTAAAALPDYCFPARLEEIAILEAAMRANPRDARSPYYLGNLLYDRRRHQEAIALWERSAPLDPTFSVVWRNLGIGYFNVRHQPLKARAAYDKALACAPADARLLYERDQLGKRLGESPARRLRRLEPRLDLVRQRDDLSLELCALYNQTGQPVKAMQLLSHRRFQPWEGGEGRALEQHARTQLALGREALRHEDFPCAANHFERALASPPNLGEARHLLANQSDAHYWLGVALDALGEKAPARRHWRVAASAKGDFQDMSVRAFSEMTYYSALAWQRLGQQSKAAALLNGLLAHARKLAKAPARIDYFATSLPTMLLFEDDLQFRQTTTALFLEAQAWLGLGHRARAKRLLRAVLRRDPNHALAADLLAESLQP